MPGDPFYASPRWRALRAQVFARDRYCCTACGTSTRNGQGHAHHRIPRKDRPDLALSAANVTTLCRACHNQAHDRVNDTLRKQAAPIGLNGFPAGEGWE